MGAERPIFDIKARGFWGQSPQLSGKRIYSAQARLVFRKIVTCHMAMGSFQVPPAPMALPVIGHRLVTEQHPVIPTRTALCESLTGHAELHVTNRDWVELSCICPAAAWYNNRRGAGNGRNQQSLGLSVFERL